MSTTASPAMLLRLYLVRHGETEWSLSGRHTGRTDLPLTARWIGLAVAEAQHFALGTASLSIFAFDPHHTAVTVIALWIMDSREILNPASFHPAGDTMATGQVSH